MKTLRTLFAALAITMMSIAASAQPMSVYSMRNNARFLTDRMAYTLGLSAAILDDLYYINYDYICGVNDYLDAVALGYRYDDYMEVVYARDYALRRLLSARQWELLMTYDYFYRPISFVDHRWSFSIYLHDRRMDRFYYRMPRLYDDYRGGRFFTGMRRIDGPMGGPGRPYGAPGAPGAPVAHPNGQAGGPGFHIGEVNNNVTAGRGDVRAEAIRQGGTINSTIRTSAVNGQNNNTRTGGFTIGTPAGNANQNMGGTRTNATTGVGTINTRTSATAGRVGNESSTRTITTPNTTTTRSAGTATYNNNRSSAASTYTPTRTTTTTTRTSAASSSVTRSAGASSSATRSAGVSSSATRSAGVSSSATRSAGVSGSATRSAGASSSAIRSAGASGNTVTRSAGRR